MIKIIVVAIILTVPSICLGANTIGLDSSVAVYSFPFLTPDPTNPEYAQVFNYFVTLEILFGLFALFIRMTIRPFRM